jgi:hypothetical protein
MTTFYSTAGVVGLAMVVAAGLGALQWMAVRRLVGRPNRWVAASVVGAAVNAPLSTGLLLDTLVRAGLPTQSMLPVGLGLLGMQLLLGTAGVSAVLLLFRER